MRRHIQRGFTLVEVLIVAPIVILSIGAFIALVITLTGNTLVSRESSIMQYNVQDALDRIDEDVRMSAQFLAANDIALTSSNPQGYRSSPSTPSTTGSTVNFKNIDTTASGGSPASLVLKQFAYTHNPAAQSSNAQVLYRANAPNSCAGNFKLNTPMYTTVVYFVAENALWRRVIVPTNYQTPSTYCGGTTIFQRPSCAPATTHSYCVTQDSKLVDNVAPGDFKFTYYPSAGAVTPNTNGANPSFSDAVRDAYLLFTDSVEVSLTAKKSVAGRETVKSGERRSTRLNSTTTEPSPTAPAQVSTAVINGSDITVEWPSTPHAAQYDVDYRVNGGAWVTAVFGTTSLSTTITGANHDDDVTVRVLARNSSGASTYATKDEHIPLWAPLALGGEWTDYGGSYTTAAYTKTSTGYVLVRGLIKATTATSNEVIAQLPPAYRPTGRLMFGTTTNSSVSARVDVGADGSIIFGDNGNVGYFSLETIRFIAASTSPSRTSMTLQNSFTNYGGAYAPATYIQDSTGRISIQGLLSGGTRTSGTVISPLTAALRPDKYLHHASRSSTFHHLGIDPSTGLVARGDGTGAYSITLSYFPSSYTSWTNLPLSNGWVVYSSTYPTAQYTKTSDGVVHLRGLVKSGTIGSVALGTLPSGFRPAQRVLSATSSGGGYGRIDINANGQVYAQTGANSWFSLSGISFIAEQ